MSSPTVECAGPASQDDLLTNSVSTGAKPVSRRNVMIGGLSTAFAAVAGSALGQGRPTIDPLRFGPGNNSVWGESGSGNGATMVNPVVTTVRSWQDVDLRLLRRTCYGVTEADRDEIKSRGYNGYLEWQLNPDAIDDSACEGFVTALCPLLTLSFNQLYQQSYQWGCTRTWMDAVWTRSIRSKRQLRQRLLEFWSDHFYIDQHKFDGYLVLDYYRSAIYPNVLGTFRDLLVAVCTHGSMMYYLDNRDSTAGHTNVNFSRELMELYTLGTSGGYTEDDVYSVADIFTGWGCVENPNTPPFSFLYTNSLHAPGSRTVMGQNFPQAGMQQGLAFLDWLAANPKTAEFVGNKLCRFFLGKNASPALMTKIKQAWGSQGDIKAVLRQILAKSEMASSVPKFKRPNYLILGAIREAGMMPNGGTQGIIWELRQASMEPMTWKQPNSWPDSFEYWSGGMVRRIRFGLRLAAQKVWALDVIPMAPWKLLSEAGKVEKINQMFFQGELPSSDAIWIRRYLKGKTATDDILGAIGLGLCSPSYQWF